jgi:DNA ligase-1
MLANSYFDKPEIVNGKSFALTTKIDGGRIIAIKENGNVSFYTRAGQKYEGLVDLENELKNLPVDNICFDGEITLLDPQGMTSKDQYKHTMKITRKDGEKHGVKMLVFDYMSSSDFKDQTNKMTYEERRNRLDALFDNFSLTYFTKLPVLYKGSDIEEINKWLNYSISHGEEGVMINILDAPYEFKRTNNLLKVKKMRDIDLTVIGYEEGNNQLKGKLGALIVDYKGHQVKVGSGFTKELREEIWRHPQDYVGLTASIQYFEETTNDKGGISLRFPVFLDFRYDK